MNARSAYSFLLLLFLLITGCKEISPDVVFGPPAGLGDRVVLVEEFTGAQCIFCPPGSEELENLLILYPDNLAVVSIHTGFFATPIPNKSKYDFRTPEGDALNVFLGSPDKGYPSSIINRRNFPGETSLHNVITKWPAYIESETTQEAAFGLDLQPEFDPATRELTVQVTGIARRAVNNPLRITVMITESGIVDYQKDAILGEIPEYIHKHVLRGMVNTNAEGDVLAPGATAGQTLLYQGSRTLPADWKEDKCELVAFISDGNTRYVYQAAKKKLFP